MGILEQILSSRVRAQTFRLLFGLNQSELHIREIARQSQLNESSVRQELRKLARLDLVKYRKSGNRTYHRANLKHPLYDEIHKLVLKTDGLFDVLSEALSGANVQTAFVFGSVAKGTASSESDIDLMVIGDLGLRELTSLISGVSEKIGREINPHVMTADEYKDRLRRDDHFAANVLSGPKIYISGDDDDFETMGRESLA